MPENYYDNTNILCLMNTETDKCISTIKYKIDIFEYSIITIDSYTDEKYQNKKYNLLCRAVFLICIHPFAERAIDDTGNNSGITIQSYAANPVTVYTLLKYFDFDFRESVEGLPENKEELTVEMLQPYKSRYMVCHFPNEVILSKANQVTDTILSSEKTIACTKKSTGGRTRKHKGKKRRSKKTKRLSTRKKKNKHVR